MAEFVEAALLNEIARHTPGPHEENVMITLPDPLHDSLKAVASAEHRSANATIVVAVAQYIQARDKRAAVRAMAADIARRDRELLDRLAR
jgi:predicted transcriptional regulator